MSKVHKNAPSGEIIANTGTISVPQTAVAVTASATASAAFDGAEVGDTVCVSPLAALQGGIAIAAAFVVTAGVIHLQLINVGVSATLSAQSMRAVCNHH